jgi:hypothetical protein
MRLIHLQENCGNHSKPLQKTSKISSYNTSIIYKKARVYKVVSSYIIASRIVLDPTGQDTHGTKIISTIQSINWTRNREEEKGNKNEHLITLNENHAHCTMAWH